MKFAVCKACVSQYLVLHIVSYYELESLGYFDYLGLEFRMCKIVSLGQVFTNFSIVLFKFRNVYRFGYMSASLTVGICDL